MRPFTLNEGHQARVAFAIPYLGWIFILLSMQEARIFLIALPGVLLALWALYGVWRQGGELLAAERGRRRDLHRDAAARRGRVACRGRTLALPAIRSDARFNSVSANPANSVVADTPANYLRLYSQSTDPAGLTGYASRSTRARACPPPRGRAPRSARDLGGFKNQSATVHLARAHAAGAQPAAPGPRR